MPKNTAVTHADLAPARRKTDLGSKTGALLVVLTILCGLVSFILCLFAEVTRSQVTWLPSKGEGMEYECVYSGNGKMPLLSASGAFLILTVAMAIQHTYILIAVSELPPPEAIGWEPDFGTKVPWQAGFFFLATWICFTVGEILLLIGLSVESGHLRNWLRPRTSCLVIRQGLFCAAGVFALATVHLAVGLYLTALSMQRAFQEQALARRRMLEMSVLYSSPPLSPQDIPTVARENPVIRDEHRDPHPPIAFHSVFAKFSDVV